MSKTLTSPGRLGLAEWAFWSLVLEVVQEPAVHKAWAEVGRSTRLAVRETRTAWKDRRSSSPPPSQPVT